jgi:hypothetical protein
MASTSQPTKIHQIQQQTQEVLDQGRVALDNLIERGERLEDIQEKTKQLEEGSKAFKKTAVAVKRNMWWKNTKLMIIIVIVTILILIAIIVPIVVNVNK